MRRVTKITTFSQHKAYESNKLYNINVRVMDVNASIYTSFTLYPDEP